MFKESNALNRINPLPGPSPSDGRGVEDFNPRPMWER